MIRVAKPRNARSKRALEKRESKEFENGKTALFIRGAHSSERVAMALRELALLKKPLAIPFNKTNELVPFDDASSLEFWGKKNDASLFLHANHQKKRPHNLTWARSFDGTLLDMYEMGIEKAVDVKSKKNSPTVGARPMFHFSGPHFAAESTSATSICTPGVQQSFQHLKSILLDFYRGEEMPPGSGPGSNPGAQAGAQVALQSGLQYVISVVEAPSDDEQGSTAAATNGDAQGLAELYKAGAATASSASSSSLVDTSAAGRVVHFRVYALVGTGTNVELEEIGPSFDFVLRRRQMPTIDKLNASLRRPKLQSDKNRQGKGGAKKNIETDEMGDMVGRVHVGKQDLSKLQTRKMKGLKRARNDDDEGDDDDDDDDGSEE